MISKFLTAPHLLRFAAGLALLTVTLAAAEQHEGPLFTPSDAAAAPNDSTTASPVAPESKAAEAKSADPAPGQTEYSSVGQVSTPPPSDFSPSIATPLASPDHVAKRLFGVIPNNRADQKQSTYTPLTTAEKFRIARSDSFDWPNYFLLAGFALESQVAAGGFSHNGGMPGFGEAYGRALGDQIIGSYVTEAILPTLLHEDPRYFRLGTGRFWHRAGYATSRIFVNRKDNGQSGFNFSEIVGNAGFVALATTYYNDERSASEWAERYGMQLGNDAITNLLTEFWPDIRHRLRFPRRRILVFPY